MRAETLRVLRLSWRRCKQSYVSTEGVGKFEGHMAEATQTNHPNFLAFANLPKAERGISRDAGAEEGSR